MCGRWPGPILGDHRQPIVYERGSWGPKEADELAGPDGWLLQHDR